MATPDIGTAGTPDDAGGPIPRQRKHGNTGRSGKKQEIVRLLADRKVPEKDDILRVKRLIREFAGSQKGGQAEDTVTNFVSAYFDLYLGRITGDETLEKEGMRRCLAELAQDDRVASRAKADGKSSSVVGFPGPRRKETGRR